MDIYVAHIIKTAELLTILKKYNVGLEVELFSSSKVLDNPKEYILDYREALGDFLESRNISVHGPFNELIPASRDLKIRELTKQRFDCAFQRAKEFGAKRIIYHTGFIPKTYSPKEWLENSIEFWTDFVTDKLDDIQIHVENVYEDDFTLISQLVSAINHPDFSVCLDVGHINANSTKPIESWIDGLNDKVKHIHLHNNDGFHDNHNGLQKGEIDMPTVLKMLKSVVPNASMTLEIFNSTAVEESLNFLHSLGFLEE